MISKTKPLLSWNPLRYVNSMIDEGKPSLEEVFAQARDFGLSYIELHHQTLRAYDRRYLDSVVALMSRYQLGMSQFTCAPDFTHPDPEYRRQQLEEMKLKVEVARVLGAAGVRVTVGCAYPQVSREQGVTWAVDALKRLAEFTEPRGVKLGLENHYKDRRWVNVDFAFDPDVYLEVFHRLEDTPVGVNFDCANSLMTGKDPLDVLRVVKHKMWHVHASDRCKGEYTHTVVSEGEVPYEAIFQVFRDINYTGFISLEDGQTYAGDEGTRRSLNFLRSQIDNFFSFGV